MPLEVPFICNIVVKCHYLFQYIYFIGRIYAYCLMTEFIVTVLFLNMLLLLLLFMLF